MVASEAHFVVCVVLGPFIEVELVFENFRRKQVSDVNLFLDDIDEDVDEEEAVRVAVLVLDYVVHHCFHCLVLVAFQRVLYGGPVKVCVLIPFLFHLVFEY